MANGRKIIRIIEDILNEFFPVLVSTYIGFLALRFYEGINLLRMERISAESMTHFLNGGLFEVYFVPALSCTLIFLHCLIRLFSVQVSKIVILTLCVLLIVFNNVMIDYFLIKLEPLGLEFLSYDAKSIISIIGNSVDINILWASVYVLIPCIFITVYLVIEKKIAKEGRSVVISIGVALWFLIGTMGVTLKWVGGMGKEGSNFQDMLFQNHTYILASAVQREMKDGLANKYKGEKYPLLRTPKNYSILSSKINKVSEKPNIVFIIVEGLSETLVGKESKWGGFTPYIDSLRKKSIYWPNTLSTSSSSFNVIPSLLASLPYDEDGFNTSKVLKKGGMKMPNYTGLVSILEESGYKSSYYGGYKASFNSIKKFLQRENIDKIVDIDDLKFDSSKKMKWGFPDRLIVKRLLSDIDREGDFHSTSSRLDIVRTNSLHTPFDIPNEGKYEEKFKKKIDKMSISDQKKERYLSKKDVLATALYADSAVQLLIESYLKYTQKNNTLFVLTGDHHFNGSTILDNPLRAFHVPLILFSKHLQDPQIYRSVSSHLQVAPTLLSFLTTSYDVMEPQYVHWMGKSLNTSTKFESKVTVPLMRGLSNMSSIVVNDYLLYHNRTYKLEKKLNLKRVHKEDIKNKLRSTIKSYKIMTRYVFRERKLMK